MKPCKHTRPKKADHDPPYWYCDECQLIIDEPRPYGCSCRPHKHPYGTACAAINPFKVTNERN